MASQTWNWVGVLIVGLAGFANVAAGQSLERFTFAEPHLGTIVEVTLYAPEETVANEAVQAAFNRVKELDQIFSDYKPDSELMRLCDQAGSGRTTKVSSELFEAFSRAIDLSERTDGAFDVTVGPLVQLWRRARKQKSLPTQDELSTARTSVGWKLVSLNEAEQTVELKRSGMRLDFGGIAKGFIAQDVSRLLQKRGLNRSLVAVAGDIVAGDPPPDSEGWRIGIAPLDRNNGHSNRTLTLKNLAVSTSGDAFQFFEIEGTRYSHILDPRTGVGLTERSSVTVISRDGATSDGLATAACVLGPQSGLKLIESTGFAAALMVFATDEGIRVFESTNFATHESQ